MSRMTVYTTEPCGYCRTAKALLAKRGIAYEEINLARDPEGRAELVRLTGMMTFPQVVIDGEPLGGYQELVRADRDGAPARAVGRSRLARPRLAALAHVGPAPRGAQLAHRAAAAHARLALAQVDEEAVLEGAADPVGVAEVVDRRALGLDAGLRVTRRPRRAAPRTACA